MKIAIIGAGSTYTPELIEGLILKREELPLSAISLMDIDDSKLKIVGGLANRMLAAANMPARAELTTNLDDALAGADYVLCQIRVGRLPARILDETIPLKYDLIGQETTGVGGFFKALRTIPVIKRIAERMDELCPNAWMVNFSNPSGILAEMVLNYTNIKMIGLCNCPINMIGALTKQLGLPESAEVEFAGLNHLSWITSIRHDGREYLPEAIEREISAGMMTNINDSSAGYNIARTIGAIPNSYQQYYYFRSKKLQEQKAEERCRGEVCVEIEEKLLAQYADESLCVKPPELSKRGGARYSEAAVNLISAIYNDKRERHVVNVLNGGAMPFLNADDAVEVAAVVGRGGAEPIPLISAPNPHIAALSRTVKAYEKLAVVAGLTGDIEAALNALVLHPLIGDYQKACDCFFDMIEAHRRYLPQFSQGGRAHA